MKYREIVDGIFLDRPNRFIAHVDVNGTAETVHRRIWGQRISCSGRTLSEGSDTIGAESCHTVICAAALLRAGAFLQGESVVY